MPVDLCLSIIHAESFSVWVDKGDNLIDSSADCSALFLRVYLTDVTCSEHKSAAPEYLSGEGKCREPQECEEQW